tara:strand:+ start:820 stop:1293 length:474 start_codon:yes stop_codon:yes gene_type:complete
MKSLILIFVTIFAVSCIEENKASDGKGNDVRAIRDGNLNGVVAGKAWDFIKGRVAPSRNFPNEHSFDFWDEDISNECDPFTFGGDRNIMGVFPLKVGTINLNNTNSLTFYYNNNNLVTSEGKIEILEITDSYVGGKLKARFDSNNYVEGEFRLEICQ